LQAETERLAASAARLNRETGGVDGCVGESCVDEARLQAARQSAQRSRVGALSAAVEQRRRVFGEAQATIASLESSLKLAQDQVNMIRPLAEKNIVPQTELLSAQRELVDVRGRLNAARQGASRATAAIREAQAQMSESQFQYRQDALNERSQINTRIAVNEQTMRGAQGRLSRTEIRSPVAGVINDVQVTTVGGFLNAGQKIMQIVPMGDKLLIEARVAPGDIAFIKIGDRANVKVTAYDFSIYGGLSGQISADSIYDEVERQAYFTVIVETDRAFLLKSGKRLPITPGMICDVEIMTGRKSVLSYLLKPVIKARSEALTER
jgi:adhesin transport system membrane fusion protein